MSSAWFGIRRLYAVSLLTFLVTLIAGAGGPYAREPVATPASHRFEPEISAFEIWDQKNAWPRGGVLFVGSSSIRLWQTAAAFPHLPVSNRGFGGSTIPDVNHFFDRVVLKYRPRVTVFYSGDNDIAGGASSQQVFDDFKRFVERTHGELPETQILVLSIKPSLARRKLWPKMQQANALIAKLADDDPKCDFVDVAAPMLAGKDLPSEVLFGPDGLHLNETGYKAWNDTLRPKLAEVLGSTSAP